MSKIIFNNSLKKAAKTFLIMGEVDYFNANNGSLMRSLPDVTKPYIEAIKERKVDSATALHKGEDGEIIKYSFYEIPSERNRNTGHLRTDCVYNILSKIKLNEDLVQIIFTLRDALQVFPAGCAVAKSFPLYSKKKDEKKNCEIQVGFSLEEELPSSVYEELQVVSDSIRLCANLVDHPCGELNTNEYLNTIQNVAKELPNVTCEVISGEKLKEKRLMGIWNVGKASLSPPALAILKYTPKKKLSDKVVALVGKGIVYDSGGLSLKPATAMAGMKSDMAGSSACLGAFKAAVKLNYGSVLYAVLCLAENAIGPGSQRVDDIYVGHSGLSVEVTNTDAEGRLVLGDGISYTTSELDQMPTHIIDVATLTGAQLYVTGSKHAAVMSSSEDLEKLIVTQGAVSGDWCFPMLYAPEILNAGYNTPVADMRNTVKDNGIGAHSSCAGNFIESHINKEWKGKWAHLDIAYPARNDGRSTGYGVSILLKSVFAIQQS